MGFGIKLRVWGDYACFTRPEMKGERVSYDVMTPSAARAIVEAIHWKPAIRWQIDKIHIINEIRFQNIRRNELADVISSRNISSAMKKNTPLYVNVSDSKNRVQRAAMVLYDVEYIIEAHFELTDKASDEDTQEKHYNIFLRRARKGQCFNQPYLGTREFSARFELLEGALPLSYYENAPDRNLSWMLYDIDYENNMTPMFFCPFMRGGCIDVPALQEVKSYDSSRVNGTL